MLLVYGVPATRPPVTSVAEVPTPPTLEARANAVVAIAVVFVPTACVVEVVALVALVAVAEFPVQELDVTALPVHDAELPVTLMPHEPDAPVPVNDGTESAVRAFAAVVDAVPPDAMASAVANTGLAAVGNDATSPLAAAMLGVFAALRYIPLTGTVADVTVSSPAVSSAVTVSAPVSVPPAIAVSAVDAVTATKTASPTVPEPSVVRAAAADAVINSASPTVVDPRAVRAVAAVVEPVPPDAIASGSVTPVDCASTTLVPSQ